MYLSSACCILHRKYFQVIYSSKCVTYKLRICKLQDRRNLQEINEQEISWSEICKQGGMWNVQWFAVQLEFNLRWKGESKSSLYYISNRLEKWYCYWIWNGRFSCVIFVNKFSCFSFLVVMSKWDYFNFIHVKIMEFKLKYLRHNLTEKLTCIFLHCTPFTPTRPTQHRH